MVDGLLWTIVGAEANAIRCEAERLCDSGASHRKVAAALMRVAAEQTERAFAPAERRRAADQMCEYYQSILGLDALSAAVPVDETVAVIRSEALRLAGHVSPSHEDIATRSYERIMVLLEELRRRLND